MPGDGWATEDAAWCSPIDSDLGQIWNRYSRLPTTPAPMTGTGVVIAETAALPEETM